MDAKSGYIYSSPFNILGYGEALRYADVSEEHYEPLSYKLRSRLFVVRGCPEDENCATYFYEWKGSQFKLIHKFVAFPVHH